MAPQLALIEPNIERRKLDRNFTKALKLTDMLCFLFISYIISCFDLIHVSRFFASRISFCGGLKNKVDYTFRSEKEKQSNLHWLNVWHPHYLIQNLRVNICSLGPESGDQVRNLGWIIKQPCIASDFVPFNKFFPTRNNRISYLKLLMDSGMNVSSSANTNSSF